MTAKPKSKQEEALQFLDDLDSIAPPAVPAGVEGEADALAFIDEITQKTAEPVTRPAPDRPISRAGTPTLRKPTERVKLGGSSTPSGLSPSASSSSASLSRGIDKHKAEQPAIGRGGWGWSSMWSTASAAIQQAKTVVDEQVKALPNEQARKWGEGVIEYAKSAQLDKLGEDFKRVGLSTLTDLLNVVAPPISEHEVIQVWLSHEMQGFKGVESLVYRALAKVMEQVEGGDLVVNRGDESHPKQNSERNINAVEGYDAALKLAQADMRELIRNRSLAPPLSSPTQTTYSDVFLRIQPYFISHEAFTVLESALAVQHLQFLICLVDPANQLTHVTVSQTVLETWLDLWDEYEWVEDLVADVLRIAVEVVGQEYLVSRMGWGEQLRSGVDEEIPSETADNEIYPGRA